MNNLQNVFSRTGLLIGVFVIVGIFIYFYTDSSEKNDSMMENTKSSSMDSGDVVDKGTMMEDGIVDEEMGEMMSAGSYIPYSEDKIVLASSGPVVLFFRASWCPTCRALDVNIKSNLSNIPKGVTILDVDYDIYKELKKKYGVTYQHTLVQVDSSGNQITKWSGGSTLIDLISKIKS